VEAYPPATRLLPKAGATRGADLGRLIGRALWSVKREANWHGRGFTRERGKSGQHKSIHLVIRISSPHHAIII